MTDRRDLFFGSFRLDRGREQLFDGDRMIHLKPKEWQLLCYLVERPGRLVGKHELIDALWPRQDITEANLSQTVYRVRQALGDSAREARWIETRPRTGYTFLGAVRHAAQHDRAPWPGSLAVLPFVDLASRDAPSALSLGLADALIHTLSDDAALVVRSLGAVIHQPGGRGAAAGTELEVDAVLDGTIQEHRSTLTVRARLLDSSSGRCRWTGDWTLSGEDRLAAQRVIAGDVCAMLRKRGAISGVGEAVSRPEQPAPAQAAYMRGRYCWHQFTEPALHRALEQFDEALAQAPRFAEAHAWRSAAWSALGNIGALTPRESAEHARRAADRAIAIDDQLAAGYEMRAVVELYFDWNHEAARRSLDLAIDRDHRSANAYHLRANALAFTGNFDAALEDMERALRFDPTALITQTDAGYIEYLAGRHDAARVRLEAALSQNSHFTHARLKLAFVLAAAGDVEGALTEARHVAEARGSDRFGERAWALGITGHGEEARTIVGKLETAVEATGLDPLEVALGHLGLGDSESALRWLQRAEDHRSRQLAHLAVDPVWLPLRHEPRFRKLALRIGFLDGPG